MWRFSGVHHNTDRFPFHQNWLTKLVLVGEHWNILFTELANAESVKSQNRTNASIYVFILNKWLNPNAHVHRLWAGWVWRLPWFPWHLTNTLWHFDQTSGQGGDVGQTRLDNSHRGQITNDSAQKLGVNMASHSLSDSCLLTVTHQSKCMNSKTLYRCPSCPIEFWCRDKRMSQHCSV